MSKTRALALVAFTLAALGAQASADRKNPLLGQPEVRRRYLLNDGRFEITPSLAFTVAADLKHTIAPGVKAMFHLNDYLWFGGEVGFGAANINTGLFDRVLATLPTTIEPRLAICPPDNHPCDFAPSKKQAEQRARDIGLIADAHVAFSPWFGKMAIFQKWFINMDLYFMGGVGFVGLKNTVPSDTPKTVGANSDGDPRNDIPDTNGIKIGPVLGGGFHFFFNRFTALNFEFKDYIFNDNPSGFNITTDHNLDVTADDMSLQNHLFATIGFTVYFPTGVKISK